MKKLVAIVLAIVLLASTCFAFTSCTGGGNTGAKYKVGVCQLVQHPALDQATQGFVNTLKAEFGDNIEIDIQNASGEANACTTIVNKFKNTGVDLIMANATPALNAAFQAIEDIPILGTSITEYGVALGKENFTGVSGMNVSGTSDLAPLDQQAQMILDFMPNVKIVGILYCASEPNSAYQVKEVKKHLESKGVTVKEYKFTDSTNVKSFAEAAASECQAIYVPTDNVVALCADIIGDVVIKRMIPLFAGEENIAKSCGVASLTISYYDLGVVTGQMAIKVLKGEADVSTMPIEYATPTRKYNKEMCELLELVVPADQAYEEIQ